MPWTGARVAVVVAAAGVAASCGWQLLAVPLALPVPVATTLALNADAAHLGQTFAASGDPLERGPALAELEAGRIASRALSHLRLRYVDPDKIDPPAMLEAALQAVAHLVPEMLVDVPQKDAKGDAVALRLRVGEASLTLSAGDLGDLYKLNWKLLTALRFVAAHLPGDVAPSKVEYVAVNGLLSTLDPYSHMLDPDAWRDMQTNTGGNFGGLGIVILAQDGWLTVQSVIPGSPAERAGMQAGDTIQQIDGEDTLNMAVDEAVDRLRGEVGTAARLMMRRAARPDGTPGWPKSREVVVVRAVIHLQSVEHKVLDNGVGYAKIKHFQRGTAEELARAIEDLKRNGSQDALVLDLRDNPGGLLDEAIRTVDLFLASGPAVITVTGGQRQRDPRLVTGTGRHSRMHLAVLISGHSASAAEVVAGALKYSDRAIVLGEQSFGKASVQVPYEIGAGALKLTVAKYLVPGDVNIHGVGIAPDVGLQFVSATREQIHLFGGPRYSRALKKARAAMAAELPSKPRYNLRILLPEAQPSGRVDEAVVEGPAEVLEREPRQRAAVLLRRAGDVRASVMLAAAQADIAEMAAADDAALVSHLKRQGIDWRPWTPDLGGATATATPQLRVTVADPQALVVPAGEVLRMSVTVHNLGAQPLHRLHVLTACDDPALDGHEQLVGRLDPGQSRTVNLRVRISMRHGDLQVPVQVRAAQDGAVLATQDEVVVTVQGREPPDFAFRYVLDDATPPKHATDPPVPGDGMLQPGETAQVRIEVFNRGEGMSQAAVVTLRSLSGQRLHLGEGRARQAPLAPGGQAVARLAVGGKDVPAAGAMPGVGAMPSAAAMYGVKAGDFEPAHAELTITDEALGIERKAVLTLPWGRRPLAQAPGPVRTAMRSQQRKAADVWDAGPRIVLALADPAPQVMAVATAVEAPQPVVPARRNAALVAPLRGACHFAVAGTAWFDPLAPRRRFVTASVAGVKQAYHAGHGQPEVPFAARLRLDSGLNAVTIQAQAGPHQVAERVLLVHCTPSRERLVENRQGNPPP